MRGGGGLKEVDFRQKLLKDAKSKGHWARSVNDRFQSAYPDFRLKVGGLPQIDMELKICRVAASTIGLGREVNSGLSKLQVIEIREMNKAGVPAVGIIYIENLDWFTFTNDFRFNPKESTRDMSVEAKRGKPDWEILVKRAFYFLETKGYDHGG